MGKGNGGENGPRKVREVREDKEGGKCGNVEVWKYPIPVSNGQWGRGDRMNGVVRDFSKNNPVHPVNPVPKNGRPSKGMHPCVEIPSALFRPLAVEGGRGWGRGMLSALKKGRGNGVIGGASTESGVQFDFRRKDDVKRI
jgi:hypothetical protein